MNVNAEMLWTLWRALAIAAAALAIGAPLAGAIGGLRGSRRASAWVLLLAPALTPSIVVGYAAGRSLLANGWNEAFYAAVVLMKLVPVAVVVLALVPSPATPAAWHSFRLLGPHPPWREWRFRFHAAGRGAAIALALVFLLAFTEFELAALCSARSWTVALFDAHAGGLALTKSLRLAALPAAVEALVLAALWLGLRGTAPALAPRSESPGEPLSLVAVAYLALALLLVTALPLARIFSQAGPGFASLVETFSLGTDLAASACFAFAASTAAWTIARPLARKPAWSALSLPGLLGALVLSLAVLAVFQLPALRFAYDTPAPLLLALALLLLPLAVLLRWILDAMQPGSAVFLAAQTGHRELIWRLDGRRRFAAWALLFCWAFFDFTAASILAPVGFSPVFVRLHNLMHYGQTAVLSAMVCLAFATPAVVLLLTGALARTYPRRHAR